jgi:hypothetical protein
LLSSENNKPSMSNGQYTPSEHTGWRNPFAEGLRWESTDTWALLADPAKNNAIMKKSVSTGSFGQLTRGSIDFAMSDWFLVQIPIYQEK